MISRGKEERPRINRAKENVNSARLSKRKGNPNRDGLSEHFNSVS